jgi:hypothetical protein
MAGEGGKSSFSKWATALGVVGTLGAGGAAGVGYGTSDASEFKYERTIHAEAKDVFKVLSDPAATRRWMPQEFLDIEKVVPLKERKRKSLRDFLDREDATPSEEATDRFELEGGRNIDVTVATDSEEKDMRVSYIVRDGGFDKFFKSVEWGFEVDKLPDTADKKDQCKVIFVLRYHAVRPLGVLVQKASNKLGLGERNAKRIMNSIERTVRED